MMTDLNEDFSNENITVIFVLGGPGSGKSTQSTKIAQQFGFTHFSTGDLLREESKSGSEDSVMIQKTMEKGEHVPSTFVIKLLQRAMKESGKNFFLIDGFPRNLENLDAFSTLVGIEPKFVLYLYCSEEVMMQRLLKRNQGRNDDNIATITKRFEASKSVYPVIQFYHSIKKLHMIDAEKSVDEVFEDINTICHHWTNDSVKLIAPVAMNFNTIFHHGMNDSAKVVTTPHHDLG
ncbi:adenylate kinase [Thalictrum thalictroides]|uniref:adenylate kinase n=1 Tax=Thalictrum thalictroides TaxID=46969 RepID=A0A7J6WU47_THATH|nr:adenylate kinase [Thalictrum thalictroides]